MTVIVPAPPPVDIPFGHPLKPVDLKPAPVAPVPLDPAVPRAVLAHSIVAAAAVLPTLTPALPSHEPEYRLASKRKTRDDDDDDALENVDHPKRLRTDEPDSLFGPLSAPQPSSPPPPVIPAATDALSYTLEQAIVAILTTPQEPTPQPTLAATPPAPTPSNAAVPAARLPTSPLASFSLLPTLDEVETPTPAIHRPLRPPQPTRAVETPLWKIACRTRVDAIIETYGAAAVRAAVAEEARRLDRSPFGSKVYRPAIPAASPCTASELQVEIYTPSHFVASSSDLDASEKSDSDFEDDVDMSFDLDESDEESEEDDDEDCIDMDTDMDHETSPHESVVELPPAGEGYSTSGLSLSPSAANAFADNNSADRARSPSPPPISLPRPIALPSIPCVALPLLPRLRSVPVYCLRTYPDLPSMGTPPRIAPWACGRLTREDLQMRERFCQMNGPRPIPW